MGRTGRCIAWHVVRARRFDCTSLCIPPQQLVFLAKCAEQGKLDDMMVERVKRVGCDAVTGVLWLVCNRL